MLKDKSILTTIIQEVPEGGFIGFIEEIPGINTQGETKEEVQKNLDDALNLAMDITDIHKKIEFLYNTKIHQLSLDIFGNKEEFINWLTTDNFYFDKKKPVEYLKTISGIQFIYERMEGMKIGDNV
jgi:predicted RNase H-like HicB family nuclease